MLQRNLLYTAVTRARKIVVLVRSPRPIARAVRTEGAGRRYTALAERLRRATTATAMAATHRRDGDGGDPPPRRQPARA